MENTTIRKTWSTRRTDAEAPLTMDLYYPAGAVPSSPLPASCSSPATPTPVSKRGSLHVQEEMAMAVSPGDS
jgi:hypothetical protein